MTTRTTPAELDNPAGPDSVDRWTRADAVRVLAVFVGFGAGAVLSWESFGSWGGPSFFYPAAGITVAAMILTRRALWPAIALAVIAAEILVDLHYGASWQVSVAFAAANVVEPLIGALLTLSWCAGRPDLRQRRDFVSFIAAACLIAPVFGALVGGTASSLDGGTPWLGATATWWAGDALGILVTATPILLWAVQSQVVRQRPGELAVVLAASAVLSVVTFAVDIPPSIFVLPVLAWAAFRLDMLGAAITGAVAAFVANIMTTQGRGLFASSGRSQQAQVYLTQIFVAVIVIVALLIAQEAAARLHAVQERDVERRERIRLQTLSRLAIELAGALTPEEIGDALEDEVLNEAGAQALGLGLVSADGQRLEWITAAGYPADMVDEARGSFDLTMPTLAVDVVRSGRPIYLSTAAAYAAQYPDRAHWLERTGTEAIIGWPLSAGGEPFGVLQMTWSQSQPMDDAQLSFVSAVSTMVSQALVRAKVYADEHARAVVLHSVAQPVAEVDVVGLEYRALYWPADAAHGLGGDWFSVMSLPGRRTYLAVGDVIGHGLASVQDMAQLRSTGDAYAHQGLSPALILTELNRFAAHKIRGEFATNLVAVFDPSTDSLSYSSAGHLPALLRRAQTGEVVRLTVSEGPILGPFVDSVYEQCTVNVGPGDVLVMYTDGLVEHHDEGITAGIAHLEQVIAAWPPDALLDCDALARDVAPSVHTDDICLVVARFGALV